MWKPALARPDIATATARVRDGFLRARRVFSLQAGPPADSVWWQHGRIQAVGTARVLEPRVPPGTPTYEYPDAIVTPGFVDAHTHFAMWALGRRRVQLAGAETIEEAVRRVGAASPVQGWVVGQGWDANRWDRAPERRALDAVQPGPVYLDSLDVHAAWVNTAALAAAGIGRATPDPYGGRIVRDAAGEPTGLLLERAIELMTPHLPDPPPEALDAAVRDAQAEAHRLGLTGIHDVESTAVLDAFRRLDAAEQLRLRVLFHPPVGSLSTLVQRGIRSGIGGAWLRIGGVKLFLDGSLGSRTAWMLEPYTGTADRGMPITSEAEAALAVRTASEAGLAATVHAIGDAAVRRALDLLTAAARVAIPHRIEHFQCVSEADLSRAARAGIVASMQPAHLLTDVPLVDAHWGSRGRGAYAFETLRRHGTTLAFGSDVPVAALDPRDGLVAALGRHDASGGPPGGWRPEERLTFQEVVRAYTEGPAVAAGIEQRSGALVPGYDADLVAWAFDPAVERGDADAARAGCACMTVVDGEVVMQR